MVHIITKEELKDKLLTSPNLCIVDWRRMQVYDPWSQRIDVLLSILEKDEILCFEIDEEEATK